VSHQRPAEVLSISDASGSQWNVNPDLKDGRGISAVKKWKVREGKLFPLAQELLDCCHSWSVS
jgi:hypothetical protein